MGTTTLEYCKIENLKLNKKIEQILFTFKGARTLFVCFLLFTIILFSCKKTTPVNKPIDLDTKSHFNFQSGTYWIYKDSITGSIDSFYVNSNIFSSIPYTYFPPKNGLNIPFPGTLDRISIGITDAKTGSVGNMDTISYQLDIQTSAVYLYYKPGRTMNYIVSCPLFTYPFNTGTFSDPLINEESGTAYSLEQRIDSFTYCHQIFPQYNLDAQIFLNVAEISVLNDQVNWFYVNDSIGMIKMRLNYPNDLNHPYDPIGTKVWELQRWHIVK